jgi:orotidine-5'-phosphate decarboxylase
MIIDKLIEKIKQTSNPTVVGLDPRLAYIPDFIKNEAYEKYGKTPKAAAESFYRFNKEIIDAVYDLIPAVKPQVAMYEQFGAEGIESYINTIKYAKSKGLVIIGDIKRSDIASTAEAYSDGHIGRVSVEENKYEIYHEDFITLNPYLGYDSIEPYMDNCKNYERGLFVLVKTSNPNSGQIQDLVVDGEKLYEKIGRLTASWGEELIGQYGYSSVGAVVGATHPEQAKALREIMPKTYFLVPGYGAQGGTAKELSVCFNKDGLGAIVNSSRGIIAAHQNKKYKDQYSEKEFAQAARAAVEDMKKDLATCFE